MNNPITPDDITRLAERAAEMLDMFEQALVQYAPIADIERWPYHPEITDTADELRTLAQQQGKAGGRMFYVSADDCMFRDDWKATTPIIYSSAEYAPLGVKLVPLATPPAHSPDAGVTDALFEIVEEAFREGFASSATYNDVAENTPDESWEQKREYFRKRFKRVAAPQPKDAER